MHIPVKKTRKTKIKLIGFLSVLFCLGIMTTTANAGLFFMTQTSGGPAAITNFNGDLQADSSITGASLATKWTLDGLQTEDVFLIQLDNKTTGNLTIGPNSHITFLIDNTYFAGRQNAFSSPDGTIVHTAHQHVAENDTHFTVLMPQVTVTATGALDALRVDRSSGPVYAEFDDLFFREDTSAGVDAPVDTILTNFAGMEDDGTDVPELPVGATSAVLALLGFGVLAIRKKLSK